MKLSLRDKNRNIVTVPKLLTRNDIDTNMLGPFNAFNPVDTFYIRSIDNSNSSQGFYYLNYTM